MSFCLVRNHSIDYFEEHAVEHFAGIQIKNLTLEDFTKSVLFFDKTMLGLKVYIVPIENLSKLTITWP